MAYFVVTIGTRSLTRRFVRNIAGKELSLLSAQTLVTDSEALSLRQKLRCFDWRETPMVGCYIIINTRLYAENNQGVFPMAYDRASLFTLRASAAFLGL
jgi:hypothetical protein